MAAPVKILFATAVILIMKPFPVKVLGYNPMSMCAEERAIDICEEASNFDFILFSGVAIKAPPGGQAKQFVHNGSTIFTGGWINSNMSNQACGCSIIVGTRFNKSRIHDPVLAPGALAGRGISLRVASRLVDFTLTSTYFPTTPPDRREVMNYRNTCKALSDWISKILCSTPGCSTPVLYCDLNDGMGIHSSVANGWM